MLIVVHYCYRFLCTVVTDSCALLLLFSVHSIYHFLRTRRFCLQVFCNEMLAEACLDRLVHKSLRFELRGDSMRKKY